MDWTQIVIAVLGLVGVIDLGRLIFFRSSKKKAEEEAEAVVQANDAAAVATLKEAIEQMSKLNGDYSAAISSLNERVDDLLQKGVSKDDVIATLLTMICKHMGCSLREPIPGQGRVWFDQNKSDISLGVDYLPINQLMVQYGERRKQERLEAKGQA